jgi:hypothetical protein
MAARSHLPIERGALAHSPHKKPVEVEPVSFCVSPRQVRRARHVPGDTPVSVDVRAWDGIRLRHTAGDARGLTSAHGRAAFPESGQPMAGAVTQCPDISCPARPAPRATHDDS